jgi:hypothetical protein
MYFLEIFAPSFRQSPQPWNHTQACKQTTHDVLFQIQFNPVSSNALLAETLWAHVISAATHSGLATTSPSTSKTIDVNVMLPFVGNIAASCEHHQQPCIVNVITTCTPQGPRIETQGHRGTGRKWRTTGLGLVFDDDVGRALWRRACDFWNFANKTHEMNFPGNPTRECQAENRTLLSLELVVPADRFASVVADVPAPPAQRTHT